MIVNTSSKFLVSPRIIPTEEYFLPYQTLLPVLLYTTPYSDLSQDPGPVTPEVVARSLFSRRYKSGPSLFLE